jgi:hypothetical protein
MAEQSNDYKRGYAAGRRREGREEIDHARQHQRHMARYALAAAIAPGIIESPWVKSNGERIASASGIAGTITSIVLEVEKRLG